MKLEKIFSALMLIAAVSFTACDPVIPDNPDGPGKDTTDTPVDTTEVWVIPEGVDVPAEAITVAEARDICSKLESGAVTTDKYYVKGFVKKVKEISEADFQSFGNLTFFMVDQKDDKDDFEAFQVNGKDSKAFLNMNEVEVGDYVVVYGNLTNYNGTYETTNKGTAYVYSSSNANFGVKPEGSLIDIDYQGDEANITDFLAEYGSIVAGDTTDYVTVRGVVKSDASVNLGYGTATFTITNGVDNLYCYGIAAGKGDGETFTKFIDGQQLVEGDFVTVYARLYNYNGKLELIKGYITRTSNTFDGSAIQGPDTISVAEANEIGKALASGKTSPKQYVIVGRVTTLDDISVNYGNLSFHICDVDDESATPETFYIYRAYYLDNKKYTQKDADNNPIEVGDVVTILGQIMNYNGTPETPQGGAYVTEHIK